MGVFGIYTSHCSEGKKPRLIGQVIVIDGRRAIAYMKKGSIESYIYWDELYDKVWDPDVPEMDAKHLA